MRIHTHTHTPTYVKEIASEGERELLTNSREVLNLVKEK